MSRPEIEVSITNRRAGYYVHNDSAERTLGPMDMVGALKVAAEQFGYTVTQDQVDRSRICVHDREEEPIEEPATQDPG